MGSNTKLITFPIYLILNHCYTLFTQSFQKDILIEKLTKLRKENSNIFLRVTPSMYIQNNGLIETNEQNFTLLSSISNSNILSYCNELKDFEIVQTDRFGFNNPDHVWNNKHFENIIIGDSYAAGTCVKKGENFVDRLREYFPKTLNLAQGSNGPLVEYASLVEYTHDLTFDNLFIVYFEGNELEDLEREYQSTILKKYVHNANFLQYNKLFHKEIDTSLRNIFDSYCLFRINNYQNKKNSIYSCKEEIKSIYMKFFSDQNQIASKTPDIQNQTFKTYALLLQKITHFSHAHNGKQIYFLYLPSYEQLLNHQTDKHKQQIEKLCDQLNIKFIDIEKVFLQQPDPINLFPYRKSGHYTSKANELIQKEVLNAISK